MLGSDPQRGSFDLSESCLLLGQSDSDWLFPRADCKSRDGSHSTDDEQFYGQSQSKMVYGGVKGPELVPNYTSSFSAFKKTPDTTRS